MSGYPSSEQVAAADNEQLFRWYRFLPSPTTQAELEAMETIGTRWREIRDQLPPAEYTRLSKLVGGAGSK